MYMSKKKFDEIKAKHSTTIVVDADVGEALAFVQDLLEAEADAIKNRESHATASIGRLNEAAYGLMFHKITLRSGYYTGVQFYVEVEHDLTEDKDYTNDDCHYYFDCCRSVAYRKYEAEIRKINRKLAALGKEYGFQEYVCTARFSNGEAWYDLASNSRARLKSVVA